jgi:hypothetical protein
MKIFKLSVIVVIFATILFSFQNATAQYLRDSLTMDPGYATDIFYSLANGEVATAPRDNWDIAFFTPRFSAGIMVNEGSGVNLFTYPKGDTSAWTTMDTIGLGAWPVMYNSSTNWEDGAFNANQTGHPDYGWGTYNMVTHNLTGDSLYVVLFPDMSVKKLWIVGKVSAENLYHFKYANLDGSDEQDVTLNVAPYESKRFAYYSLRNNLELDREPDFTTWDLLFTKFIDLVPDNEGNMVPYLVTGATSNFETMANHFYPVADDFNEWASEDFSTAKNVVGANWKYFDMTSFSFQIVDSTCYFVKSHTGDVFKISFVYWGGSSNGNFALDQMIVSLSSIGDVQAEQSEISLYPVPADNQVTVQMTNVDGDANFSIYDLNGRVVFTKQVSGKNLETGAIFQLELRSGMYLTKVSYDNTVHTKKLMIR